MLSLIFVFGIVAVISCIGVSLLTILFINLGVLEVPEKFLFLRRLIVNKRILQKPKNAEVIPLRIEKRDKLWSNDFFIELREVMTLAYGAWSPTEKGLLISRLVKLINDFGSIDVNFVVLAIMREAERLDLRARANLFESLNAIQEVREKCIDSLRRLFPIVEAIDLTVDLDEETEELTTDDKAIREEQYRAMMDISYLVEHKGELTLWRDQLER